MLDDPANERIAQNDGGNSGIVNACFVFASFKLVQYGRWHSTRQPGSVVAGFSSSSRSGTSTSGHTTTLSPRASMKCKADQERQKVIQSILRTYGAIDRIDVCCLALRFHVDTQAIVEDVRSAGQSLKQQALELQREARAQEERRAELTKARQILHGEPIG